MTRVQCAHNYNDIISVENLLAAWREFVKGKRKKKDVEEFQLLLMENILSLHRELASRTYKHGKYRAFNINDPKPRNIHKALVRDRLLHHAIYRKLYPFFDRTFISDSFSCRLKKSTHRVLRVATKKRMLKNLSRNPTAEVVASYRGMLLHGNTQKLAKAICIKVSK